MLKSKTLWPLRLGAFALLLSFVGACNDDSTSPNTDGLVQTQGNVSDLVDRFFTQNEGLQSFEVFGAFMGDALIPPPLTIAPASGPHALTSLTTSLRASVAALGSKRALTEMSANIPVAALGVTFIYDPASGTFQPSSRVGAPPNGVRFILYDGVQTLNEIGYVDIIDSSTLSTQPMTIDVSLQVFVTGVGTVVSYRITGSGTDAGDYDLLVDGFLGDGTDQLDYTLDIAGSEASGSDANFSLTFGTASINLRLLEQTTGDEQVTATIFDGTNTVVMALFSNSVGDVGPNSQITFNGTPVAVFSGNFDGQLSVTKPNGDPLSAQEEQAIGELFLVVFQAAFFMLELLVVGVGLIGLIFI